MQERLPNLEEEHKSIHFQISSTRVIWMIKLNKWTLLSIEIKKPFPTPRGTPVLIVKTVNTEATAVYYREMKQFVQKLDRKHHTN